MLLRYEKFKSDLKRISFTNILDVWPHFHRSIELIYLLEGSSRACAGDIVCDLKPGDFFIAFPETIHQITNSSPDINAAIVIVSPDFFPEYSNIFEEKQPTSPVIHDAFPETGELFTLLAQNVNNYSYEVTRSLLSAIFGMLFEKMDFCEIGKDTYVSLHDVLKYCENNYTSNISLNQIAKDLHISTSYVSYLFSNKINIPFRSYINSLRIDHAEKLLNTTDKSITSIAAESGFESIRTFNRVFKHTFDTTPYKYRAEQKLTNQSIKENDKRSTNLVTSFREI